MRIAKNTLFSIVASLGAVVAGAAVAAGLVALVRGDTRGAPGITKAFARIGKSIRQSMLTGVALAGAAASVTSLALYASARRLTSGARHD